MKFLILFVLSSFSLVAVEKNNPAEYKVKLKNQEEISASFKHLDAFLKLIQENPEFTIYEALPYRSELLDKELKKDSKVKRYEYFFYPKTVEMKKEDLEVLKKNLFNKKSYSIFKGFKKCGGYRPTFSFYFSKCDVELQLCLGCNEAKIFHKGKELYCNFSIKNFQDLKDMLFLYRINSPKTKGEQILLDLIKKKRSR